jgi:hypothetical protein
MIFGHIGFAFLLKSAFYKRSLVFLLICSFLPDIVFYILFGIQWTVTVPHSPLLNGLFQWILTMTKTDFSLIDNPLPLSHSIALWLIVIGIFLILWGARKKLVPALFFGGVILSHLLFDFLLPDANMGVPLVYPFYPFDPSLTHFLPYLYIDASVFWLIDLSIFILGLFALLWAFSNKEGRTEII